jgi:3-methyladenine DNA glycosylase AlkC
MAEPFKNLLHPALVERTAEHLGAASQHFRRRRFLERALDGLDGLEMKARAMQIADALEESLPADFEAAAQAIEAALAPPHPGEDVGQIACGEAGLAGWIVWPLGEFVARRGLEQPARALECLHALTQRFSAEFAIRPFLVRHPEQTFERLYAWCRDPSFHVRRLCSEGSRPRLPWGLRLSALVKDPGPTEPILRALQDDPSAYVRRSVANHLNDIAKDHPGRVAAWVEEHLPGAGPERRRLLEHASRTLIKAGNPRLLAAFGSGRALRGSASLHLSAKRLPIGGSLALELTLTSSATRAQPLRIDLRLLLRKSDGRLAPKVFKGWKLELAPNSTRVLEKRLSFRPVTTRRLYPGPQALEVLINGRSAARAEFRLTAGQPPPR